jgi:hypothetical protein
MRRIYESDALHRDDDPGSPSDVAPDSAGPEPVANRHRSLVPWGRLGDAVLPTRLRDRAIGVSVDTDRDVYASGEPVCVRVRLRNRLPVPVTLHTPTRRRWDWAVDGDARAARDEFEPAPRDAAQLAFSRSETKTFTRTWRRRFRVASDRWTPADPGRYEISAFVAVADPETRGLLASTEIELTA